MPKILEMGENNYSVEFQVFSPAREPGMIFYLIKCFKSFFFDREDHTDNQVNQTGADIVLLYPFGSQLLNNFGRAS